MQKETKVIELNSEKGYQRLLLDKVDTIGMKAGRVYLAAGQECGSHSTEAREETLVFLSGKGEAIIGEEGKIYEVGAGKVAYFPPHTIHNVRNTGVEPLVYVFCVSAV